MRKGFALVLTAAVLFGGGYFYYIAQAVCPVPLAYTLGELDGRFNLSRDEARLALSEAESVWEDATGQNLFSYEEDGELIVNFIYDERQEFVEAEGELKEKLDATEHISEAIGETYAALVADYNDLRIVYADKAETYERKLNAYNDEVEKYNKQGGAPAEVYESLSSQKEALNREQTELNTLAGKLNKLVNEINNIGEKGNKLINTYNQGVHVYNETFGESREFTQGDYSNNTIKIYTFEDKAELNLVLVHELGHALSLDHVDGKESVMFYLIGDQPDDLALSEFDVAEFNRVCGNISLIDRIMLSLRR
jgi:regulator of replication initiation timing